MAGKPQLPKGEGRGRWDKTHQIALLTDLEVEALNHLRWRDKERGFSSGSGPEIKELAAKNSRPFEFVDYKGEKIPSLNDSGSDDLTGSTDSSGNTSYNYSGSSGDSSGAAGNTGTESAWAKKKRLEKEARDKAAAEAAAAQPKRNKDGLMIDEDGNIILGGRAGSGKTKRDHETDAEYAAREHPMFSNKELAALRGGDNNMHRKPGETAAEYHNRLTGVAEGSEGSGNEISVTEPTKPQVWTDWKGNTYDNPADAEEANQGFKEESLTAKKGEGGAYGHEGIGQKYTDAYQDMLSDAYDAAHRGVEMDIGARGYFTGTDYDALEAAVPGQEEWLTGLGTAYEKKAKDAYDAWYDENIAAIEGKETAADIDAYQWTDMPEFDLDLTGGSGFGSEGEYDPDYIPEFYEGFRKEYGEDYSDPTMPDEWGGNPENIEPDENEVLPTSTPPVLTGLPTGARRVKGKIRDAVTGLNPFSTGSARYY